MYKRQALDFAITRKPHEVSMREAGFWSAFYIALPLAFGLWVLSAHGGEIGLEYYTGYLVEKSLSVDNLFVFMLIITAFAGPPELQQRVLLIGIIGALILRGIFIALGAQLITNFAWAFLLFGLILVLTAVKILKDTLHGGHTVDVNNADRAGLRWYELRKSSGGWSIFQQGSFSPDTTQRWMGSAAMNSTDFGVL